MRYIHIYENWVEIIFSERESNKLRELKNLQGTLIISESPVEILIEEGIVPVPAGKKYDATTMSFIPLSIPELYDTGQITKEEYNDYITEQRLLRFNQESDPLFMEMFYEEVKNNKPKQLNLWADLVEAIKQDLPYIP